MFRLALKLGIWNVPALMASMPSSLFQKWSEFERVEPFGQPWENWLMAVPAFDFAQVHKAKGKMIQFGQYMYVPTEEKMRAKEKKFISFLQAKAKRGN